jgi:tetratricopeptide (TPR) repeat protein
MHPARECPLPAGAADPSVAAARRAGLLLLACACLAASGCSTAVRHDPNHAPSPAPVVTPLDPVNRSPLRADTAAVKSGQSWSELVKAGRAHLQRGELPEAEDSFARAYDLARTLRPSDARVTASVNNLQRVAEAYLRIGQSTSFARVVELLVHVSSELPTARTRELARLLQQLATLRSLDGRPAEALETLELAREILEEEGGAGDAAQVGVLAQLALVQVELGDLDAAEQNLDRAAEIAGRVGGDDGLLVATTLLPRARLELARGNPEAARQSVLATIEVHEVQFGANHPATARVLREAALFEQEAGDTAAAEKHFNQVIEIWDALPNEHYQRAQSRNELAWLLVETGAPQYAEAPARAALGILEERQVGGQPLAAIADTLATALRDQRKYDEAEDLYQDALIEGAKASGLAGWDMAQIAERYAVLLEETGRPAEAADLRRQWQIEPPAAAVPTPEPVEAASDSSS